ncbi:MAG TPA: HAD family phosphatase [Verrucomicrobiae bacterium]|nr:HAD family phosphatase [Verrucomicrobiae bacterium]
MHKAIIFDLGRTLVNFDFARGYRALEPLCPYSASEIPERLATTRIVEDFETGLIEPRDFVEQMGALLGFSLGYDRFCEIWSSIFMEALVPESLVGTLAERYRLVLLSNTNAIHFEMIRDAYPVLRHFHELALSYEVKAMKPRREIFDRAVDLAGCLPGECFYTDDIAEYVAAARELGIDAAQFRGVAQLEEELRSRGIV